MSLIQHICRNAIWKTFRRTLLSLHCLCDFGQPDVILLQMRTLFLAFIAATAPFLIQSDHWCHEQGSDNLLGQYFMLSNISYCTECTITFWRPQWSINACLVFTLTEDDFTAALVLLYGNSDNCTMTREGRSIHLGLLK